MRVSSKQFCFSFRETVFLHWFLFMFQPRSNHLSWQQLYGLILKFAIHELVVVRKWNLV